MKRIIHLGKLVQSKEEISPAIIIIIIITFRKNNPVPQISPYKRSFEKHTHEYGVNLLSFITLSNAKPITSQIERNSTGK